MSAAIVNPPPIVCIVAVMVGSHKRPIIVGYDNSGAHSDLTLALKRRFPEYFYRDFSFEIYVNIHRSVVATELNGINLLSMIYDITSGKIMALS